MEKNHIPIWSDSKTGASAPKTPSFLYAYIIGILLNLPINTYRHIAMHRIQALNEASGCLIAAMMIQQYVKHLYNNDDDGHNKIKLK